MKNKNDPKFHSIQLLQMSFDVLSEAIEICDCRLPYHARYIAINSRNRSLLRLKNVIQHLRAELMEEF